MLKSEETWWLPYSTISLYYNTFHVGKFKRNSLEDNFLCKNNKNFHSCSFFTLEWLQLILTSWTYFTKLMDALIISCKGFDISEMVSHQKHSVHQYHLQTTYELFSQCESHISSTSNMQLLQVQWSHFTQMPSSLLGAALEKPKMNCLLVIYKSFYLKHFQFITTSAFSIILAMYLERNKIYQVHKGLCIDVMVEDIIQ